MHISITNEIVHKVPFPTLHTLPRWHSQSVEGYITNYKWKHSICALAAWRKAFGCSFALNVCSSATEPGRLKKAMVWVICNLDPLWWFFLPPLLSPSFAAGDPTPVTERVEWHLSGMGTGRQRAEAVAQGKASATAQMATENPTPWAGSCNTGNVRSSLQLIRFHKWVFQEAGCGARVHGRVHYGDINIIHVWHDENFLQEERKAMWRNALFSQAGALLLII